MLGDDGEGIALVSVSVFETHMQKRAELIRGENEDDL